MIQEATQADIPRAVSRRRFLSMLVGGSASVVAEPKKTFAFFGNILRRPTSVMGSIPPLPEGLNLTPEMLILGAGIFGAILMGTMAPALMAGLQKHLKGEPFNASQHSEALSRLREHFPAGEANLQGVPKGFLGESLFVRA